MVLRRRITGLVDLLPFLVRMVAHATLIINAINSNLLAGNSFVTPDAYTLAVPHIALHTRLDKFHAAGIDVESLSLANQSPVANDDMVVTLQDTPITINVLENDYDPDGDSLMVIDTTYSQNGLLIIYPYGVITYMPGPGHGIDEFTYTISDGRGGLDTATVTIKIHPVVPDNKPPVADAGPDQTVLQGTEVTLNGFASTDPDYDIITYNWYEGSSFLGSGEIIKHTFPLGTHTVRLVVTDIFSQIDSDEAIINVVNNLQEYFTEQFSSYSNYFDLSYKAIMFTPTPATGAGFTPATDGTNYSVCLQEITQLPTNPIGSTHLELPDDSCQYVSLNDQRTVSIFGSSFPGFYVGSNGYITFAEGDNDYSASLSHHFATKRISCLLNDLDPYENGEVSWKQLADRVVVTWDDVIQHGMSDYDYYNTFQIEMYFDGRIRLAWLWISAEECIIGLSDGFGLPVDFHETDFSEYPQCGPVIPQPVVPSPPSRLNYLTEQFYSDTDSFDLSYKAIMFTPTPATGAGFTPTANGASYSACLQEINQLPTDPAGGTYFYYLGDNDYEFISLNNQKRVSIFGSSFPSFYVSANGYITFTEGDRDSSESLVDHFSTRRISALFYDLDPFEDGRVSWKQLADRVVVTWVDVPLSDMSYDYNTFQIEMYFDGRIQLAWLRISAEECIVGLSDGLGLPIDFQETDFSEYLQCNEMMPSINPIAHWTMDDNAANNYVLDSSGRGNHGTAQRNTSALSVAGIIDSALSFNGLNDYISVPDNPEWTFTGDFSITVWIKFNTFNPKWWESAFIGHDEGPRNTNKWIFSYDPVDSKTLFHINHAGTSGPFIEGNQWAAQAGVWYFIAVTRSGSTYTFYREGISDGARIDGTVIPDAAAPLTIGWAEEYATFNGALDDIRIYNRALSAAEITALYNGGAGP